MSDQINLIRTSFEKIMPLAEQLAEKFFTLLFTDYPDLELLFKDTKMASQQRLFIGSLEYIVEHLDKKEQLTDYLEKMGTRHVTYDVEEAFYPFVGGTFLKTLEFFIADDWTPELETAWSESVNLITQAMIDGARKSMSTIDAINTDTINALSTEEPVAEVPVAEVPVAEVPVAEVPVAEVPVAEVPVAEVPVAEVPQDSAEPDHSSDAKSSSSFEKLKFRVELPESVRTQIHRAVSEAFAESVSNEVEKAISEELEKFSNGSAARELKRVI
jgi:hemoglobin-like flavoprotein